MKRLIQEKTYKTEILKNGLTIERKGTKQGKSYKNIKIVNLKFLAKVLLYITWTLIFTVNRMESLIKTSTLSFKFGLGSIYTPNLFENRRLTNI